MRTSIFALAAVVCAANVAEAKPASEEVEVTFLGHATFEITSPAGTKILIDPFLAKNPLTPKDKKDLSSYKPDAILVTHSHFDHSADAVGIAKNSGAKVIGSFDHVQGLDVPAGQKMGGNVGGKIKIKDVTVHLVPAMHASSPGGRPLGFVIEFEKGATVYHTGDTWIFGDMSLIAEIYRPKIILLQVGGGPYNQDPQTALLAMRKYFRPKVVIPMHYGTFPPLSKPEEVKKTFSRYRPAKLLEPGETLRY